MLSDRPGVGFVDEPQPVPDYADLWALETGALVPIAWALYTWFVPFVEHVVTGLIT